MSVALSSIFKHYKSLPRRLRAAGVMGMNQRNHDIILKLNERCLYPILDDKILTKKHALTIQLPTPELLWSSGFVGDAHKIPRFLRQLNADAVLKPSRGSGGKGILVLSQKDGKLYNHDNIPVSDDMLIRHATDVMSGLFSLHGQSDTLMIEERIRFSNTLSPFSPGGVPDIRIIVYKGYPAMAMVRLATKASQGKANLHQGGVGVGIEMGTGKAIAAVQHRAPITHHPDTGIDLRTLQLDNWETMLEIAARCHAITKLGYFGTDIVIDRDKGPLLLELNARPGLAIQIASQCGLQHACTAIDREIKNHAEPPHASDRAHWSITQLPRWLQRLSSHRAY